MNFNTETTTQQWMNFLNTMNQIPLAPQVDLRITQTLPMYHSPKSRRLYIKSVTENANNKFQLGEYTRQQADAKIAEWSLGMSITIYVPMLYSNGTLSVITNALGNASEQASSEIADWHVYATFYQHGILGIYDPSYIPGTRTLDACIGIQLVKRIIKMLRSKKTNRTITEVWIGGGGNDGRSCQEMTRRWIYNEIEVLRGADLGNWEGRLDWTKLHF